MVVRSHRRVQLRSRILVGVLAVTLVAFAAFDVVAVTLLQRYLLGRTDSTLTTVLDLSSRRLPRLIGEARVGRPLRILDAGLSTSEGVYDYLAWIPDHGSAVVLGADAGIAPRLPSDLATLASSRQSVTVTAVNGGGQLRLRALPARGGTLVVTTSLAELDRTALSVNIGVAARMGLNP